MIHIKSAYLSHENSPVFDNLNLDIKPNEKVLILGKSGMGKTTLFKVLLGFALLDKGQVLIKDTALTKENIKQIRNQMFYLSQDVDLKNETVSVFLAEIEQVHQLDTPEPKLKNFMDLLELSPGILTQNIKDLSGGERQRLGLLTGFILDRPIWLLDEPTSALDDAMKKKITQHILNQDKTMIITSHDDVWKQNFGNHTPVRVERWG